jgi:glycosyl transferase, family 25
MSDPDSVLAPSLRPIAGLDAIYVLSVKTFADRIAHVRRQMAEHQLAFEFVFDYDIDDLTPELQEQWFEPRALSPAHRSLVLKHAQAWRLAQQRGQRRILVFEDDVLLDRAFRQGLEIALAAGQALPEGWLVFLGGADTKVPDAFFLADSPLFPLPLPTAEGYLTDVEAVNRRLKWFKANRANLPADHLINRIDRECGVAQYWMREPIVQQGSVFGLFTSKLDRSRLKHSAFYNWARYNWNKIRRRRLRGWWVRLRAAARG